jgi:hypothetical protein
MQMLRCIQTASRLSSFCRTVGALDRRGSERIIDIAEPPALVGKFVGKGENTAFTRAIGSKPPTRFLQMTASAFPFLVEPACPTSAPMRQTWLN